MMRSKTYCNRVRKLAAQFAWEHGFGSAASLIRVVTWSLINEATGDARKLEILERALKYQLTEQLADNLKFVSERLEDARRAEAAKALVPEVPPEVTP